jgi:hypothetical protein
VSVIDFIGTFNSTANPLPIPPSIFLELGQDASSHTNLNLTGKASVMNSPCVTSLTLSGQAIGGAFSVTDAVNKMDIIALPSLPSAGSLNFSYKFDQTAASCPGTMGAGRCHYNNRRHGITKTPQHPCDTCEGTMEVFIQWGGGERSSGELENILRVGVNEYRSSTIHYLAASRALPFPVGVA